MSNKKIKKYQAKLGETDAETGYVKPEKTMTDSMTNDDIKKVLEDYTKVNANTLVKSDHVRYFVVNDDNTVSFRLGGWVLKTDGLPDYIVLTNGKLNWSVQCVNAIFYKLMTQTETIDNYKVLLALRNDTINNLNDDIKDLTNKQKEIDKANAILLKHNKIMTKELTKKDKQIKKLEDMVKKLQKK